MKTRADWNREYKEKNGEKLLAYGREYREKNKEILHAKEVAWQEKNREIINEKARIRTKKKNELKEPKVKRTAEDIKAYQAAYREKNRKIKLAD